MIDEPKLKGFFCDYATGDCYPIEIEGDNE
jgi:hypothetical protein